MLPAGDRVLQVNDFAMLGEWDDFADAPVSSGSSSLRRRCGEGGLPALIVLVRSCQGVTAGKSSLLVYHAHFQNQARIVLGRHGSLALFCRPEFSRWPSRHMGKKEARE
jgi:hypothetical protein